MLDQILCFIISPTPNPTTWRTFKDYFIHLSEGKNWDSKPVLSEFKACVMLTTLIASFLNHVTEGWLTYTKLYMFGVTKSLETSIHSMVTTVGDRNTSITSQRLLPPSSFTVISFCDKNTYPPNKCSSGQYSFVTYRLYSIQIPRTLFILCKWKWHPLSNTSLVFTFK